MKYKVWIIFLKAKRLSKVYHKRKTCESKRVEYTQAGGNDRVLVKGKTIQEYDIVSTSIVI